MTLAAVLSLAGALLAAQEPAAKSSPAAPASIVAKSDFVLTRFDFDEKQTLLATLSTERQLALWEVRSDKLRWGDDVEKVGFSSIEVALTDKLVIGACAQSTYRALRLKDAENDVTRALPNFDRAMTSAAIDPEMRWMWFGSEASTIVRCDLAQAGVGRGFELGHSGTTAMTLTPDGELLFVAGRDKSIRAIEPRTGEIDGKRVFEGLAGPAFALVFDAKGALLASGGEDGSVRVWTAANGKAKQSFVGHPTVVRALAFDPKAALLASGDDSGLIKVWRVANGELVAELAHEARGAVTDLEFGDKGKSLYAACGLKGLAVWDLSKLAF